MAKTSTFAIFGGSGTAVMAASPPEWLGLTPGEWQIAGIVGGLLVGLIGVLLNLIFKVLHYQLAKQRAGVPEAE